VEKIKILVVGTCSPHVANHINRIRDENNSIEVISNGKNYFSEKENIHLVDFSLAKFWNLFFTVRQIRKILRTFQPDLIHIHQANSVAFYTLLANKRTKIPSVLTAWGSDVLLNPKKSLILRELVKFNLKNADFFTSDAVYMAEEMRKLVPEKQLDISICNFGVAPLPIAISKENIIYSNRNHNPLYRIDQVICGFDRFSKSNNGVDWKLVIAGSGSETQRLKDLVQNKGLEEKVSFVGFVNTFDNFNYYAKARIFVSLPESDATAMSLLEAMYYQCIPVLSNLPANREWVENGINGIIVRDLEADFFNIALSLNQEEIGAKNKTIIQEKGTEEVSKRNFKDLILKAVSK
jgi:glycosyltransferase involved in cell wall biosynthesis